MENYGPKYDTKRAVRSSWAFVHVVLALLFATTFMHSSYSSTASQHTFTYFNPPDSPGALTTDRGSIYFAIDATSIFAWATICMWLFLWGSWRSPGLRNLTLGVTIVFAAYYFALSIWWSVELGRCNSATAPDNICNDPRWCCVYFSDPVNECPNFPTLSTCTPGVGANDLTADTTFILKFAYAWAAFGLHLILVIMEILISRQVLAYERVRADVADESISKQLVGSHMEVPMQRRYSAMRKRTT